MNDPWNGTNKKRFNTVNDGQAYGESDDSEDDDKGSDADGEEEIVRPKPNCKPLPGEENGILSKNAFGSFVPNGVRKAREPIDLDLPVDSKLIKKLTNKLNFSTL